MYVYPAFKRRHMDRNFRHKQMWHVPTCQWLFAASICVSSINGV